MWPMVSVPPLRGSYFGDWFQSITSAPSRSPPKGRDSYYYY